MYSGSIPDVASNFLLAFWLHPPGPDTALRTIQAAPADSTASGPPTPKGANVAAVILAGGKGERLGGAVKASISIGGVPLIARVTQALGTDVSPLLVAHGRHDPAAMGLTARHIPIPDLPAGYGGPLAGLAAAVDWCARQSRVPDYLVSAAVDTPFFPADFLARALAAIQPDRPGVVARYRSQDYPTDSLWRLASILGLPGQVRAGTAPRSLWRYAASIGAVPLDWPEDPAGDPFASLNTSDDLAALEARAAAGRRQHWNDKR